MALIRSLERSSAYDSRPHSRVDAGYRVLTDPDVGTVVQIETYGSDERKLSGKTSQAIQFDRKHAQALIQIFEEAFPGLR